MKIIAIVPMKLNNRRLPQKQFRNVVERDFGLCRLSCGR